MKPEVRELAERILRRVDKRHPRVPHGRCEVCGHYGMDCTGRRQSDGERLAALILGRS